MFDNSYLLIILSRFVRILVAATILISKEKLSTNQVSNQLYKMMVNLTLFVVVAAFLFTGIENKTLLDDIK